MVKTIDLLYPEVSGISQLKMRCPKVIDLEVAKKSADDDAGQDIGLYANLCGVSPDQIRELAVADFEQLRAQYDDFLYPPSGK